MYKKILVLGLLVASISSIPAQLMSSEDEKQKQRETPYDTSADYVTQSNISSIDISEAEVVYQAGDGKTYKGMLKSVLAYISKNSYDAVNRNPKVDKSKGVWKDKAFGYATAVVGLTSGLQIGGFATPFVNSCVVPLAVKAGLVKAGANFALSKLAIVGSYVGSGYCMPLLLVPLLIKCCYDAQNKNKIATTTGYLDTGSSSFGIRFKQAAKHNLSFVWNGLQPAALTILGLGFLGILAQQNK